ncbi:hypothetical protein GUITHDRAFT_71603 [Guillardia theta CCMP2712]|uniref:Protein yippee-like n=1 Tax=Guillardia theta (strain CCMP2712) TaxID=905079 RepID=L1JAS8_GUITC|nr:hypothetical protein GUITHDRAFT_71603 [Guillardia theta CCMP2712]EKX45204.1 hypothetical protein GUITHDRAFT_71603 [Guillardia theta CCMP2712]|eukprot:XP_005832184.1 hypothetical protein GUITHDRAFT_71603 [Guillardia theta CCMP2712]
MGRIHKVYLPGNRIYSCGNCHAHLTNHEALISTSFQGRTGRAYLFDKVVNISFGPLEDRLMNTGMHTVQDIYCNCCHEYLGWKYKEAFEASQKYKEGKSLLMKASMTKEDWVVTIM